MSSVGQALTAVVGGVVGFLVGGGPTGALYGFEIGLLAGSIAFPTKLPGTFGPRLTDGQTTTASVGDPVNFGFGGFTVSGTVIYLGVCNQITTTTSQGSKGAPSQTQTAYTYTQSIGIGLTEKFSGQTLRRVWENGELVYDTRAILPGETMAAAAKRATAAAAYAATFVLYDGSDTQTADPTIEADVGVGSTPAFRGLMYIVYPDRQLRDDQGQRHPTFKFEITNVTNDANLSDIINAVAARCGYDLVTQIDSTSLETVDVVGYSVQSVMAGRDVLSPLRSVGFFDVVESGPVLKFVKRGGAALRTLLPTDIGVYDDPTNADPAAAITVVEQQEVELPRQIRVSYFSVENDYQAGQQLSPSRWDTDAVNIVDVELAVCLHDDDAKQIAEVLWNDAWQSKDTYTTAVDQSNADIEPADVLIIPMLGNEYRMRVDKVNDASQIMRSLSLISDDDGAYVSTATAGAPARPPSQVAVLSATTLILLDLPALQDADSDAGFYAAAYGDGTGTRWSGCAVYKSLDGDTFAQTAALTGSPPVGTLNAPLGVGITSTWDDENFIDVAMLKGEFESRTDADVLMGANTIAVGGDGRWEIVQFGTAVDMDESGSAFTRLSHLLRGRRGTEHVVGTSGFGDKVVGLTMGNLFRMANSNSGIGVAMTYRAVTLGASISSGVDQSFTPRGAALKPFSPVELAGHFSGSDLVITWIRRDRFGLPFTSGVAVGMSEATEAYQVDIIDGTTSPNGVVRTIAATTQTVTYTSAQQIADFGSALTEYNVAVYQMSAVFGRGDPLEGTVP